MTESCQGQAIDTGINNNAEGGEEEEVLDIYGGGGANGAGAGSDASLWGIIGMAVGGVVLVAAVAGFLLGKVSRSGSECLFCSLCAELQLKSIIFHLPFYFISSVQRRAEEDEDDLGGATRSSALLTKPVVEDLESVDGTLATGDPTIASGSTGATMATMIEMARRTKAEEADEEAGGYINMDKLDEDKGLVPELDYTESEGESELMGMDYVDFDEVATGLPVAGEGGPMWAAAAAAAATTGAAANPTLMSDEETEEISRSSSQTSETQESVASSVGYQPASVPDRVAAIEEANTYLVPLETEPMADIEADPSVEYSEEEVEEPEAEVEPMAEELEAEEPEVEEPETEEAEVEEPMAEEPMAEEPETEEPETEEPEPLGEEPEAEAMADEDSVDADSDTASTTSSSTAPSF